MTLVTIYLMNTFIITSVDYCNSIFAGLSKYQQPNLVSPQCYGANSVCPSMHWLHLPQRIDFKRCLLVFKAILGLAPSYIINYCVKVSSRRCLRLSSQLHLIIPPPAKTVMFDECSFPVRGPRLWEQVRDNITEFILSQRPESMGTGAGKYHVVHSQSEAQVYGNRCGTISRSSFPVRGPSLWK